MRATLTQIAKRAGVSTAAVSQVLNNHPHAQTLRPETRKRILEAVQELGYCRNENAAEIRTGVTKTIALLLEFGHSSVHGEAAGEILMGLLNAASESGYNVKVCNAADLEHTRRELLKYGIQYAVCFAFSRLLQHEIGEFCRDRKISLCYIQESGRDDFPLVYSDDRAAMREVARLLLAEGHRRIAVVKPEDDVRYSVERCTGVAEGLREHGLKLELISAHYDPQDHFADLERWFDLPEPERPTAFVCTDDNRAAEVLITALRLGIRIPEQCRIFGFGDTIAGRLYFPVGTVSQPFKEMGEAAVKIVTARKSEEAGKVPLLHLFPAVLKDPGRK